MLLRVKVANFIVATLQSCYVTILLRYNLATFKLATLQTCCGSNSACFPICCKKFVLRLGLKQNLFPVVPGSNCSCKHTVFEVHCPKNKADFRKYRGASPVPDLEKPGSRCRRSFSRAQN